MITIDHLTRVITVPQADLTPLGGSAYELDVNDFRLWLKDLEDDADGMGLPDTHRHNTTVQLGGMTLARVVEIINGFTVEFEDGIYSVALVGGNNNIADVMVLNGVSLRSANSAGMIVVSGGGGPGDAPTVQEIRAEMDANSNKLALLPGMNTNVNDIETAVTAIDPPTAAEIRVEMDSNSVDLNAIIAALAALPAPPSAVAIRQEMDNNSVDLNAIQAAIAALPAAPSVTAIRNEMDASSTKLASINSAVGQLPSASATADAVLAKTVEPGMTFLQWLRLAASAMFGAGEVPTADDGTFFFKNLAATKNRLAGTLTDKVRSFTTRDGT